MSGKYSVGNIVDTPKGKIKILSYTAGKRLPEGKRLHPRATIEFLATGAVINIQTTNISTGKFSDYNEKTVYGVGSIGSEITIPQRHSSSPVRRVYALWAKMLKRAYGNYKSPYVGGTVDDMWHSFTNFLQSVPSVPNYQQWLDGES